MGDMFRLGTATEVPLRRAPLARVLTQVRFSRTPDLVTEPGEAALAGLLKQYPVRRQGLTAQLQMNLDPEGLPVVHSDGQLIRTFATTDDSWRVSVSETSVTLETSVYESRSDFCQRAEVVLSALANVAAPPIVDRLGLRYIDRVQGEVLSRIPELVDPTLAILLGRIDPALTLEHSVSDSLIAITSSERLQIKTGLLPAQAGFDPTLPPVAEPSWILDLDMFTIRGGFAFSPEDLAERLRRFAETIYEFFRFVITDKFLAEFGADNGAGS